MGVALLLLLALCVGSEANIPAEVQHTIDLKTQICGRPWRLELPKFNKSEPVKVDFSASLWNIARINERDQIIEFRIEISMSWSNPFLAWNASDYGGVDEIKCQSSDIWMPDVYMLDNEDSNDKHSNELDEVSKPTTIRSDGWTRFDSHYMFEASCRLKLFYFPYDNQTCRIRFASWSNDITMLLLRVRQNQPLTHSNFVQNDEWFLDDISLKSTSTKHWGKAQFSEVELELKMTRLSDSYTLNLVIPCTLISCLSLLVFLLPEESGEKIGLGITILLALTIFQQLTADTLPENGTPYISRFYLIVVLFNALSMVVTTVTVGFHHSSSKAPRWLTVPVVHGLGRVLCIRPSRRIEPSKEAAAGSPDTEVVEIAELNNSDAGRTGDVEGGSDVSAPPEGDYSDSWLEVNRVVNRLCFVVFLVGIFIAFIILFIKPDVPEADV